MKFRVVSSAALAAILSSATTLLGQVPPVPRVPASLPKVLREKLQKECDGLAQELSALQSKASTFNAKCRDVETGSPAAQECTSEQSTLDDDKAQYIKNNSRVRGEIARSVGSTETNHHPDKAVLESEYCSAQRRVAADQAAIQALGFQSDARQFAEWEGLGEQKRAEFENIALGALFDNSLNAAQDKIDAAKSLNPYNVNTTIKNLRAAGINSEALFDSLRKIAALKGKPQVAPYIHTFLEGIKAEKEAADAQRDVARDPANAKLRVLLGALKVAQGNPELGLVVTGAEFGLNLGYAYYLDKKIDQLTALTDDQLRRLNSLSTRLKRDVARQNQAKSEWSAWVDARTPAASCS